MRASGNIRLFFGFFRIISIVMTSVHQFEVCGESIILNEDLQIDSTGHHVWESVCDRDICSKIGSLIGVVEHDSCQVF